MEEGCTIDGKFHNLEVENLLTTGEFALNDKLQLKEIILEEKITVGTDAIIANNLTVDTDTLVVNATNNNVGIGITAPESTLKLDVDGNVKIRGDLQVIGTTTQTTEENTTISGPIQELGTGTTGTPSNDMGIVMERGDQPNAFMGWDESADKFIMGTGSITSSSTGDLTIVQKDLQVSGIVATNLTGTIQTAAQPNITTLGTITTGTWQGTAIADGYISSSSTWNSKQDALTFGIADTNVVKINSSSVADNEYARFTSSGLEGRSTSAVKTDLSLNLVENTALSTWAGTSNITTLGTIGTGTWNGSTISIANGGTGATTATDAASALGLGTEDTPQFTAINLGNASDTTIARSSAGVVTIEGSEIRTGTVPTNKGGTGETSYTDGKLLIGNTSTGGLTSSTLSQGSGISIINGNGSITISADASEFIGLTDTPSSFSSQAKKILQVNSSNNGLEFTNTPEFTTIGLRVTGSSNQFTVGVDNSDSNKFKIGTTAIDTNTRLTIDSSGKVGIGNSSPAHMLDVSGDINISSGNTLRIGGTEAVFSNWTKNGIEIYRNSNVGIGTTSPSNLLHLQSTTTPQLKIGYDNTNFSTISVASNSDTTFATAQSGVFNFSDNVNAQAGLDVTGAALTTNQSITQSGTNANTLTGPTTLSNTLTVGVDDTGHDVKFFGATSGAYMLWDESDDDLKLVGTAGLVQTGSGQVTFAGNVDATAGLDVTGAALTTNQAITQTGSGQVTFAGNVDATAGLDVTGAALTTNQAITQTGSGQVTFAGNVDATNGLDVTGAALTTNQAITQTGSGQVTFAGNVDATNGLDVTGAALTITDQAITQTGTNANTLTGPTTLNNTLNVNGNVNIETTTDATLNIISHNDNIASINLYGNSTQGTGRVYVGQSISYGGGFLYDGDDNPSIVGNSDYVTFFRRNNGNDTQVFGYPYNSSDVFFYGNVGIGTTNPSTNLHVESTGSEGKIVISNETLALLQLVQPTSNKTYNIELGRTDGDLTFRSTSGEKLRITEGGNVGIGSTTPTQAKLVVNGSISGSIGSHGRLNIWGVTAPVSNTSGLSISFYCTNEIHASIIRAFSDERIKKNFQDLNDYEYLQKIKQLKPCTYNYIDTLNKTTETVTGFKAQEVKDIIPGSVGISKDYIPNIYKNCNVVSKTPNAIITISSISTYSLSVGNKLKLYEYFPDTTLEATKQSLNVKSINGVNITLDGYLTTSNSTIWIRGIGECNVNTQGDVNTDAIVITPTDISSNLTIGDTFEIYESQPNEKEEENELEITNIDGENVTLNGSLTTTINEIFVYGKEIDDFHSLTNSRITPVCVAAIQEIDRRVVSNFTGSHTCYPENDSLDYNNYIGLIVISTGSFKIKYNNNIFTGKQAIKIDNSTPQIRLSNVDHQKSVLGVVSLVQDDTVLINSTGEGGIWVCNKSGNLENGDYITTCGISGYGMKQNTNKLLNSTVGKIRCNVNFNSTTDFETRFLLPDATQITETEYNTKLAAGEQVYIACFVGCTYNCG